MPANTPKGLPYPLPSEPVAEGAQAIRNLAEATDTRLRLTVIDDYAVSGSVLATYDTNARLGASNIPQTYRDLLLRVTGNIDTTTESTMVMQLNGLSAGYYTQSMSVGGTIVQGVEALNQSFAIVSYIGGSNGGGFTCEIELPNYQTPMGGNNWLVYQSRYFSSFGLAAAQMRVGQVGGSLAFSPTGVKRILLDPSGTMNFATGTRFTLYGRG